MQKQFEKQEERQQLQFVKQEETHRQQMEALINRLGTGGPVPVAPAASVPSFAPFDSTLEFWKEYRAIFYTFVEANSIPDVKIAQAFPTNQTTTTYKFLCTLAGQQAPPQDINTLTTKDIAKFMETKFDPKRFIVRERFMFWSVVQYKSGETIQKLAARLRQQAVTCDFTSIKDPEDEALRTKFIFSVGNEAVLKALFKMNNNELTFRKAVKAAAEKEDAAKVAKKTVHGSKPTSILKKNQKKTPTGQKGTGTSSHSFL